MTGPWRVLYPGPDGPQNREKIRVCRVGFHQRCSASPMSAHRDPCQSSVPPCRGCQITRGSQKPIPRVGSQGAQTKLGTRETGGGRTRFLEIVLFAGDRRKTEGKGSCCRNRRLSRPLPLLVADGAGGVGDTGRNGGRTIMSLLKMIFSRRGQRQQKP